MFPTATPLPPITPTAGSAELALINGHVITVDAGGTFAQAVAVQSGRIVAVGSNQDIKELKIQATIIDGEVVYQAEGADFRPRATG